MSVVLFCFVVFWMLCCVVCEKKKKLLITKKKGRRYGADPAENKTLLYSAEVELEGN